MCRSKPIFTSRTCRWQKFINSTFGGKLFWWVETASSFATLQSWEVGGIVSDTIIGQEWQGCDGMGVKLEEQRATTPLLQILESHGASVIIDYMSIDIEGAELDVLQGKQSLTKPHSSLYFKSHKHFFMRSFKQMKPFSLLLILI